MDATTAVVGGGVSVAAGAAPASSRAPQKMYKTLLGFVPAKSPIYALHPATRLVIYLFMSFLPLFFQMPELQLLLIACSVALYVWCGVPARNLRMYAPMLVLVFLFINFSYIAFPAKMPGEVPLVLGPLTFWRSSLLRGFLVYTRVVALLFATIVYFSTNRERDILVAFRTLHVPFVVSYFLGLVLRSAGTFIDDYGVVKEAEKARGLDMSNAPLLTKVTHFPMYMVPLFTLAIRRSEDISVGLYAKGTTIMAKTDPKLGRARRPDYVRTFYKAHVADFVCVGLVLATFAAVAASSFALGAFALRGSAFNALMGGVIS